jgi:hypothetical protein
MKAIVSEFCVGTQRFPAQGSIESASEIRVAPEVHKCQQREVRRLRPSYFRVSVEMGLHRLAILPLGERMAERVKPKWLSYSPAANIHGLNTHFCIGGQDHPCSKISLKSWNSA